MPVHESKRNSILLVKLGTHPEVGGIASAIQSLLPDVEIVGIGTDKATAEDVGRMVTHERNVALANGQDWWKHQLYVDPELFVRLRKDEGMLLQMTERLSVHDSLGVQGDSFPGAAFSDDFAGRNQVLLRSIAYWDWILKTHKVSAVIFQNIPHNFWDAVLQSVVQARNIPFFVFHINIRPFSDSIYLYQDVFDMGSLDFGKSLLRMADEKYGLMPNSSERSERMLKQVSVYPRSQGLEKRRSQRPTLALRVARRFRNDKNPYRVIRQFLLSRRTEARSRRELQRYSALGPLPKYYFFVELQRQSNATSLIKGYMYGSPREMIAHIAYSLPKDYKLVVRESSRSRLERRVRPQNFWKHIAALPNVHVADSGIESEILLTGASGVIELGYSSLAMEAICRDIPVVILGLTHLNGLPNVDVIHKSSELASVLERIASSRIEVGSESRPTRLFLEQWVSETISGTIEGNLTTANTTGETSSTYRDRMVKNCAMVIATWYMHRVQSGQSNLG